MTNSSLMAAGGTSFIVPPHRIDAEWMTSVLCGQANGPRVTEVRATRVGTGQAGDCVRFDLTYSQQNGEYPSSVIGKFPSPDPCTFDVATAQGDYEREVKFYRDLAAGAAIATAQCYLAEFNDISGQFVLLMEDLSPSRQGDQLSGVSIDQARLAVEQAAMLHAAYWNDPAIEKIEWIKLTPRWRGVLPSGEQIRTAAEGFCHRYAGRLSGDVFTVCRRYAERVEHYRTIARPNRCLAHYDFRPDNMMFASVAGGRPLTVLDWQTLSYAPGADDLAYFIAGALSPELRRTHECELLEHYLTVLRQSGVGNYGMAELERDYAIGSFRLLATSIGGAMAVQQTDRGDKMFLQMMASAVELINDSKALDYLD